LQGDPALYLHHPTVTDPSMAPPGCSTFYVLAPVPHMGRAPVDWEKEGERYAEVILDVLEERLIPDIRSRIRTRFHYTPKDFEADLFAHLAQRSASSQCCGSRPGFAPTTATTRSATSIRRRRDSSRSGRARRCRICGGDCRADARVNEARERLVAEAQRTIAAGSKSFRFASQIFDLATRERSWLLYAWCRACDDITDGQTLGHDAVSVDDPHERIAFLRIQTDAALSGEPTGLVPFDSLAVVAAETSITADLTRDHLAGFARDAAGWSPQSEDDLLSYCYQVAGAVGVMMAHVMGADPADRETLDRASDLA
jgi:hypothetical protein